MIALVFAFALSSTALVRTQDKTAAQAAAKASTPLATPLKLQIVISRYQGEKKISSLPYTLSVNAGSGRGTLRMGAKVPVMMITAVPSPINGPDGKPMPAVGPIQYQDVGTKIDCVVSPAQDDGRFRLEITVDDTSVYPDDKATNGSLGNPSFRSFLASDGMVLKDGQTAQFTTATDKVSGETVKVEVTLSVVK
jgi:hypothetical protein